MALGKEIGSFSFKITSVSYPSDDTGVQLDADGTATSFGAVLGSLTLRGDPGAKAGPASWRGNAFLDDGTVLNATGQGTWQEIGDHKWRTRMVISVSDGQIFASDGKIDLASHSLTGKNLEWS